MPEIVGISFKIRGKTYYFDPAGYSLTVGDEVIVETSRGMEFGTVIIKNKQIAEDDFAKSLKRVLRLATDKDTEQVLENRKREQYALTVCGELAEKHQLDMKLIDAEFAFDRSKVIICFTSDGRVDFRGLVRDLASVLRTRIELRQIGIRDEAKILGGIGVCGREFCCSTFINEFDPVSIKSAKIQNLSLNPNKISGACGRLMCCLKFEEDAYLNLHRITPPQGTVVVTPAGDEGVVIKVSLLTGKLDIKLRQNGEELIETHHRDEVQWSRKR